MAKKTQEIRVKEPTQWLIPMWRFIKYLLIAWTIGWISGEVTRHLLLDYYLSLWLFDVFILNYWYATLVAIGLIVLVLWLDRRIKRNYNLKVSASCGRN